VGGAGRDGGGVTRGERTRFAGHGDGDGAFEDDAELPAGVVEASVVSGAMWTRGGSRASGLRGRGRLTGSGRRPRLTASVRCVRRGRR
jgi:hypothetical protein